MDPEVLVLDLANSWLVVCLKDDTQCFILLLTLKLLEWIWLRTWKGFLTLRFHSLLFLQLIRAWVAWTFLVQKVRYFVAYFSAPSKIWQSLTVARMYSHYPVMYSQDQVCNSNHTECVLFSQSLVPRCNTKTYFLQHNTGCYQLCNNPQFPVRLQSMEFKIMRIDSVAHRLVRELIADCLGPTFKTHVRSFMNEGHVVKNATKLPARLFHLEKLQLCA